MSYTTIAKKCKDITVEKYKKNYATRFISSFNVAFFDTVFNII